MQLKNFYNVNTTKEINEYTLPHEVMEVKDIYRRTTGVSSGTGNDIEPFRGIFKYIYVRSSPSRWLNNV